MDIEQIADRRWYLAQYVTTGKKREMLFSWLNDLQVTPWTPLVVRKIRRSDARQSYRRRVQAIFPGYFFLKADLQHHSVASLRRHSAFLGFIQFGSTISPVSDDIVAGLMKIYPDPALNPGAREELHAASRVWLNRAQYQHLVHMEDHPCPESRISLLLELVRRSEAQVALD